MITFFGAKCPETKEERSAFDQGPRYCRIPCPGTPYGCSRRVGHDGSHIAAGKKEVFAIWQDEEERYGDRETPADAAAAAGAQPEGTSR